MAEFSAEERRTLAKQGRAMPDGSFPIRNRSDLENAIGLAGNAKNPAAARRFIIRRAIALGARGMIPETWSADGSSKGS
jgi:hypothetical protein